MSKVIAIGDVHGRDTWKKLVEKDADRYVFIGDYYDTHEDISPAKQMRNFGQILEYKKENKNKVKLCIGNHDFHYLPGITAKYSGYQRDFAIPFMGQLKVALEKDLIQFCHIEDETIFCHAGISQVWAEENTVPLDRPQEEVEEYLNNYFLYNTSKFGFLDSGDRKTLPNPYGDNVWQSPLWIRPQSLMAYRLPNYNQVVGHTVQDEIWISQGEASIAFIDAPSSDDYLIVENGQFKIEEL